MVKCEKVFFVKRVTNLRKQRCLLMLIINIFEQPPDDSCHFKILYIIYIFYMQTFKVNERNSKINDFKSIERRVSDFKRFYKHLFLIYRIVKQSRPSEFNLLETVDFNENTVTSFIKHFLKYKENGRLLFLEKFITSLLEKIEKDLNGKFIIDPNILDILRKYNTISDALIDSEHSINDGRVDLVIELPEIIIAIENKIGVGFTENQLKKYYNNLNKKQKPFLLTLLCPSSEKEYYEINSEVEAILNYNNFLILHHDSFILSWLDECRKSTGEMRVKIYLDDFKKRLSDRLNIRGDKMDALLEKIKEFILIEIKNNEEEAIDLIEKFMLSIHSVLEDKLEKKIKRLNDDVKRIAEEIFNKEIFNIEGEFTPSNFFQNEYSAIILYKDEWVDNGKYLFYISIEVQKAYKQLRIGLAGKYSINDIPNWLENYTAKMSELNSKLPRPKSQENWFSSTFVNLYEYKSGSEPVRYYENLIGLLKFFKNENKYKKLLEDISHYLKIIKEYLNSCEVIKD